MILSSGYAGNVGLIAALSGRSRTIFADKLNHASLNQGCLLSGGDFKRYAHCDFERLEQMVARDGNKEKLIVSDTVFSMDGDVADLGRLRGIAEKNHALLYLDDAHGSGVLGENGHGLASPRTLRCGAFHVQQSAGLVRLLCLLFCGNEGLSGKPLCLFHLQYGDAPGSSRSGVRGG